MEKNLKQCKSNTHSQTCRYCITKQNFNLKRKKVEYELTFVVNSSDM